MIEISKTGSEVLITEGLATASRVNPEQEAFNWVSQRVSRLTNLTNDEPVIILGVGSGFHVREVNHELKKRGLRNRVLAIDTCLASVDFSRTRDTFGTEFVAPSTVEGVDRFFDQNEWIFSPYTLLQHKPSLNRSPELRRIEEWILGRTPEAFLAQLKRRPQIASAMNNERSRKIAECPLVSVKDLARIWDISSELKSDRRIFRVIEELVR